MLYLIMVIAVLINTNPSVERPLQLRFELEQFESFFRLECTKNAEVGKSFDGEHATKWLYESNLKLPKLYGICSLPLARKFHGIQTPLMVCRP
jgi:hypothetical protein